MVEATGIRARRTSDNVPLAATPKPAVFLLAKAACQCRARQASPTAGMLGAMPVISR